MRHLQAILLAFGLAAVVIVILAYGFADISAAVLSVGWGIVWIVLYHAIPLLADALGWARLFDPEVRPNISRIYVFRWISESVNNLLPVAQVGGEVVRVRLTERTGSPGAVAGGTVVVDMTMGLFTQMIFAICGVIVLIALAGTDGPVGSITIGIGVFTVLIVGFFVAQRAGLFGHAGNLSAWIGRRVKSDGLTKIVGSAWRLDNAIQEIYRHRGRLSLCAVFRLLSYILGSAEIWLGLYYLGHPVGIADSVALYSLTMAVRSAAFAIPGGLGAQEGGFLIVGTMLGLSPATALALALLKRVREVLFGIPGLTLWWFVENHSLSQIRPARD